MKHWLGLVLVLTLLLCGCDPAQEPTTPTDLTLPSQEATDPSAPTQTQGPTEPVIAGLQRFPLDAAGFYGMGYLGEYLLLARNDQGTGELWLLDRTTLETVKTVRLTDGVVPAWEQLQITEMGVGFYDEVSRMMVFWNGELQELVRVSFPEEILGKAWLSPDWKKSYFCTAQGIHVMDMQTHIEVLLKENPVETQQLTGILAEGTILRYSVCLASGEQQTYLVDAATGMRVEESLALDALTTWGDSYYLPVQEGSLRKLLFGTQTAQKLLWPRAEDAEIYPVPDSNGVVTEASVTGGSCLEYYAMESGRRTASVTLPDARLLAVLPEENGNLWCLGGNEEGESLFLWELSQTPTADDNVYVTPYFTADNPDRAGLAEVQQALNELGEEYGITFLVWQEAVANNPWDHTFEGEYFAQVYEKYLPALKKALDTFPEGFLQKTTGNETRKLTVSLVRSISDIADTDGLREISGIQYWQGDTPCIALVLGEELERSLYHQVGLLVDTQVLMRSSAYDLWMRRTPPGFSYDNDYIKNLSRQDTQYLGNYFIDMFSMSYAKEDRATVFEYALLPGNEAVFAERMVQGRLQQICLGIREAFGLTNAQITLPWEQYLTQ